jgi:Zn-finger nucleic acid-binding protein
MTCPECGAPLRLDADKEYLACDYCGSIHVPEPDGDGVRDLEEPTGRLCPVCREPLVHASTGGFRIEFCRQCRGLLVSAAELLPLIESLRVSYDGPPSPPHALPTADLERRIDCPSCGARMDTHPYAGPGNIVIDNCPACELNWLDHAELRRVVRAAGWPPAAESCLAEMEE